MRSRSIPPNTIAPIRPLPTGSASVHSFAGWRYQRVRGASAWSVDAQAARRKNASFMTSGQGGACPDRLTLYRYRGQIAACDHAVDHAVLHGLIRLHNVVAIHVLGD